MTENADDIIGKVSKGKITNVTNFGAFVLLENGEEGLVHISEIANEYITNINDFVKAEDEINVKILGRNPKNKKLELSIKQVQAGDEKNTVPAKKATASNAKAKPGNPTFEDKLNVFLKKSEERQIDVRRNLKNKQGITKRKR